MKNNYISQLHFISKHLFTLLVIGLLFIGVERVYGADFYSRKSGNWDAADTWSATSGGTASTTLPGANDNVYIEKNNEVKLNIVTPTLNSITINSSTKKDGTTSLYISGYSLNTKLLTINGGGDKDRFAKLKMGSGTLNCTGNIAFSGTASQAIITASGNNLGAGMNLGGNLNSGGTFTSQVGGSTISLVCNGSTSQTIAGYTYFNLTASNAAGVTLTGNASIISNLTVEANATLNLSTYTANRTASGGTLTVAGTMMLGSDTGGPTGSNFPTNFATINLANGTVNYSRGGTQKIFGAVYNNLTLSNSGVKTLQPATTINGNLTLSGSASTTTVAVLTIGGNLDIGNGTTLNVIDNNFTVIGNTKVGDGSSGTLNIITSTNGTKTFQGDVTINTGAIWNNSINSAITFQGSLTNNSTTFTAGSGIHSFTGTAKTIGGTNANTIPSVSITGTYTNNGTLTVETALSGGGSLTQAANATLNIGGTSTITGLTATNTGNTVNYTGAAQNIHSNDYYNLTFSGNGAKTAAAGLTIGGNVNIVSGTTFDGGTFTHIVAGDWTNDGTFNAGTGTLSMTGSGKTIGGSSTSTFNNLSICGTASVSTGANVTVANNLNIGDGSTFNARTTNNLIVGGTTTIGNGTSGTLNLGGWSGTKTFTGLVTVNPGGTWSNSGNLAVTFKGGITNNGTFTSGNQTQTFDTNAQELTGTINLSGAAISVTGIELTNKGSLSLTENLQGGTGTLSNATTGTINISGNQTSSIGTLTNQGVVNIAGSYGINTSNFTNTGTINLSGTGYIASITNNAGGTVNLNASHNIQSFDNSTGTSVLNINALTYTINTLTATAADNTVNYNGAGEQAIKNVPYSNLIVSGSGTKTFTGNTTIAKTFTNSGVIANLGIGANHSANSYYLGATEQAAGSWGGIGSGVTNTSTDFTATTATLNVASGACIAGTWKGTTDTNWNTATNWCGNVLPTSSTNVIIPNVTNKPTITAAAVCNDITISAGSSLTISGTNTLTISGNFTNNGTFTANNTTVTFDGSTSQSIAGTTFDNLIVSGTGTKTFAAGTTISNTFTNNNAVVNLGTGTHTANAYYLGATRQLMGSWGGNSSAATNINATNFADATGILNVTNGPCTAGYWKGTISTDWNDAGNWCDNVIPTAATDVIIPASAPYKPIIGVAGGFCNNITIETNSSLRQSDTESSNLFVYGNWTNSGTYTCGMGTTTFTGTSLQTIGGSNSTDFYNLTIQNTGGVTLSKATTVTRTLLLISGIVNTNTYLLSVTTANIADQNGNPIKAYGVIMGGSALSYINGPVSWSFPPNLAAGSIYKFPVGNSTYLPYTLVNPTTGNTAPTVQVQAFNANPGSGTLKGLEAISSTEYWKLTTTNDFSSTQVTLGKGDVSVNPYNVIAESPGLGSATTYTAIAGTPGFYDVSNSNLTSNRNYYFTLGRTNTPTINISPVVLGGFGYVFNFGPSTEQTFTVNGTSLRANIVITAPTGYEISKTIGIGFGETITLEKDGSSSVNNATLYIRLKAGQAVGTYNGNSISIISADATPKYIECNGTVFATTPSIITSGGRNCDGTAIELGSSSDDINILYWTGPNNYYSQVQNPTIPAPLNENMFGTYTVTGSLPTGANLIVNGTFENGNVGFLSSYRYTSVPDWHQGIYGILQNASDLNTTVGAFAGLGRPDTKLDTSIPPKPTTYQMVVDGATTANVTVWSQTVKIVPNSTYQFTYWLQNIKNTTDNNPSIIQLYANNQAVGTAFTAPALVADGYKKYYYNWSSGDNTSVTLDLRNQNTISGGNDFALDDIDFRTVTQVSSSVEVKNDNVPLVSISTPTTTVQAGTNVVFSATPTNGGTNPSYVWKVTNGASVVTFPSTSNSTFNYTPVNGDVISCVMTSNKLCPGTTPTATSNEITMNVNGDKNLWKGTNSTVWSDPANWTKNKVPASGDNVEFATTLNNGTAAANDLYVDYNRVVGSLINNASGKNLVIPADKEVVVNNLITLNQVDANSKYDQIQIKSDPNPVDASRLPNGSLIFPNAKNVNATVEMYSKANIVAGAANENDRYFWQYFGIPVTTVTADPTLYGAYVRRANEAGNDNDATYYWTELTNGDALNAFIGHEICQTNPTVYTFKGQLVNTDFNFTNLAYTSSAKYPGQHLFANPYTAAINIKKIELGTDMEQSIFLYNTGSYGDWLKNTGETSNGSLAGQYISIPLATAGSNNVPGEVPSMSSMLVKTGANGSDQSYMKFNYKNVIIKNSTIQRVKSIDAISNTDLISTRIDLTGQHYSDRMWIFTEPSCTRNFDNGWDGRKILGSSLAPQIFAIEPDGDYQVNSVSDMHNTDLAFQAGDEVEYTLKFTHENIQRQYAGVYLVDLIENKTVDVTQNGSTYTFATAQSDAPAKRFKILTRSYEKGAPDKEAQVKIFTAPGRVFVHNLSTSKGECTLYDIAGRAIKNASFAANAVTEVINNLNPGAYVVNTITNGEKVSKRVIVQ